MRDLSQKATLASFLEYAAVVAKRAFGGALRGLVANDLDEARDRAGFIADRRGFADAAKDPRQKRETAAIPVVTPSEARRWR
jgi:hypothetical protein